MDVGFNELRSIIRWQLAKHDKDFRLINPANTSRICSRCGYVNNELTLKE